MYTRVAPDSGRCNATLLLWALPRFDANKSCFDSIPFRKLDGRQAHGVEDHCDCFIVGGT